MTVSQKSIAVGLDNNARGSEARTQWAMIWLLCCPLALPITVPRAALLRSGSLPRGSGDFAAMLPACPAYQRASCRAATEGKPASR